MKSLIIIFLISPIISFAQTFEGEVVYHNTYKSKVSTLNDQQLTAMMGSTQSWYIKSGDYKSETDGKLAKWQLYINKDNKLYSKLSTSEAIFYNDAYLNEDEITNVEVHKDVAVIIGYKCDELDFKTKTGSQKYYFSAKLPIDSKLFVNHKFGDWYAYLSKANAVPLKMIIETPQMVMESVAIGVKTTKLDEAMFRLPDGVKIVKNPY